MSCASAGQSPCRRSRWSSWPARAAQRCSGRIGAASASRFLTSLTRCRGLAAARRGSLFHSLTWASRVCRTAGRGRLRRELMVLLLWSQDPGGRAAMTRAASCRACSGGRLVSRSSTSRSPSCRAWSSKLVSAAGQLRASRSGGVSALRERRKSGVEAVGGEDPEVAFGGDPAGNVGVGGHDRVLAEPGELAGLLIGQGCTEWGDTDVAAAAGQGDGDGVHRSLDDHRYATGGNIDLVGAEELGSLVKQRCVGGVEVLRAAAVGVAEIRVPAANKAENLAVVDDREHDAVAEPVDETAGAGDGGHPGGGHFLAGDSAAAKMVDQSGPAGRRLAGQET